VVETYMGNKKDKSQ